MPIERLVAYCAPVLWFSRDEPLLAGRSGKAITIPEPFPFETASGSPVVYYRVRPLQTVGASDDTAAYRPDALDRGRSVIDLQRVAGIDLDFFFYYSSEAVLGTHAHDVESAQFQIAV